MTLSSLTTQRLVALFCGACLLLNFPLLGLWDMDALVWGVPLLPVALFAIWALLIFALAWLLDGTDSPQDD